MEESANGNDMSVPIMFSPRPINELDAASMELRHYRSRRSFEECLIKAEERWRKLLDFVELKRSSISFFDDEKPESVVSKWARARTRVARVVGRGLTKGENVQKVVLQHWLEAIDPHHRNGQSLRLYYDIWFKSETVQPFFYWLDVGEGKEVKIDNCTETSLNASNMKREIRSKL